MTNAVAINAVENYIPPFLIFSKVKFDFQFICDGPAGCEGDANSSGYHSCSKILEVIENNFYNFSKHFFPYVRCSPENFYVLLLQARISLTS